MGYLGSKAQAGVYQRIISQMPPHSFYIEPFFGSGQIFFRKKPAAGNVIIDADAGLIARLNAAVRNVKKDVEISTPKTALSAANIICGDALWYLPRLYPPKDSVIYCDPPYLLSTRTSRHRYNHEMTDDQHAQLLTLLQDFKCCVLISGYPSKLYTARLKGWRLIQYRTRTRGRTLTECLWCNQPEPARLHDWTYFGKNFRERLTLKRFAARFIGKLDRMPEQRRNFVLDLVHQRHF